MANILVNPDFESGSGSRTTIGWLGNSSAYRVWFEIGNGTLSFQTSVKQHGLQAVQNAPGGGDTWQNATNGDGNNIPTTCLAISPNTEYLFSIWLKSDSFIIEPSNNVGLCAVVYEADASGNFLAWHQTGSLASTQDWTQKTLQFTTNVNAAYVLVWYIRAYGHGGNLYADNASLEEVPVTSIKKVAGVAYASIKKASGVLIASVKKIAGLA